MQSNLVEELRRDDAASERSSHSQRSKAEEKPFYQTENDDWLKKAIAANPTLFASEFAKAIAAKTGPPEDELLTCNDVCKLIGGSKPVSRVTVYRHIKRGFLPRPIHPVPGIARWRRSELLAALADLRD